MDVLFLCGRCCLIRQASRLHSAQHPRRAKAHLLHGVLLQPLQSLPWPQLRALQPNLRSALVQPLQTAVHALQMRLQRPAHLTLWPGVGQALVWGLFRALVRARAAANRLWQQVAALVQVVVQAVVVAHCAPACSRASLRYLTSMKTHSLCLKKPLCHKAGGNL